jgi:hypothetical protein
MDFFEDFPVFLRIFTSIFDSCMAVTWFQWWLHDSSDNCVRFYDGCFGFYDGCMTVLTTVWDFSWLLWFFMMVAWQFWQLCEISHGCMVIMTVVTVLTAVWQLSV